MSSLGALLDKKVVSIITVLSHNPSQFYHLTQLARESNVAAATTMRILKTLTEAGLVNQKLVGKIKIYTFNDSTQNRETMRVLGL